LDEGLLSGLGGGWATSSAILGDGEVLAVLGGHLEVAVLTPVGSPGVSSDPVFLTIIGDTPSDNSDLVVDLWEFDGLLVDTTSVGLEFVGGFDTAGDWSVSVELGLHVSSWDSVVVGDIVQFVLNWPAFILAGLALWAWWPGAVLASINGLALPFVEILGDILFTRRVWDTRVISVLVDTSWVSTLAGSSSIAVDNNLGIQGNWGWALQVVHDIESVSNRRCSSLGPA
jgi:hypothetical protein